jgi:hypothetical protein
MSKNNAPIKSVSGQPFGFETRVAAYFLAHLLTGAAPWGGKLGSLREIKFYQRSFGWGDFDDLVLFFEDRGTVVKCGLSLKTDQQFGQNGANAALVQSCWELYRQVDGQKFNTATDYFGIITQHQPHEVSRALKEVLRLAGGQLPDDLSQQIHSGESQLKQKIHDSFACTSTTPGADQLRPGAILARFIFDEFDFGEKFSHTETAAQKLCEGALEAQSLTEAGPLWSELVRLANERREEGGSFDLVRLMAALRGKFKLKGHPNFAPQWDKLNAITKQNISHTFDQIRGKRIERSKVSAAIVKNLEESPLLLVEGHSGNGKSALLVRHARSVVERGEQIVFLRASELEELSDVCRPHSITALFTSIATAQATLLVDAVENCRSEQAIRNLVELLICCCAAESVSGWRVILACRENEFDRLLAELATRAPEAISVMKSCSVDALDANEVREVLEEIAGMSGLLQNKRLIEILRNAKILDVVATRLTLQGVGAAQQWAGESDVIQWWWNDIIKQHNQASARSTALSQLALLLADENTSELPVSRLSTIDDTVLSGLISERVLTENEGRIRFVHDLYADWSRQRQLLAEGLELGRVLSTRIENPIWQPAIRLLGTYLLEKGDEGRSWREVFALFDTTNPSALLARDLLLEAAAFTSKPGECLEMLWPDLTASDGKLLSRYLIRFLHACTIPDPSVEAQLRSANPALLIQGRAMFRMPYFPYWPPILTLLANHLSEAATLAPLSCAKIAKLWLSFASIVNISGEPAAGIALAVAKHIAVAEIDNRAHVDREVSEIVFEALLFAALERPDEVSDLLLKLVGRRRWEQSELPDQIRVEYLGEWPEYQGSLISYEDQVDQPPQAWPDGPSARSVETLQRLLLQPASLSELIRQRPAIAGECLLAVLIGWPKRRIPNRYSGMATDHYGFQYIHNDFPPRLWKTPFLIFLRLSPKDGFDCLLKLVNFATDRASEVFFSDDDRMGPVVTITLGGEETTWIGDRRVLNWHRSPLITIDAVVSALMAFEKWLYDEIDSGRSVEPIIERIWQDTRSLAFIGVLLSVGKKYPDLFLGPLKPLLFSQSLHHLDLIATQDRSANGPIFNEGHAQSKIIQEWENMPHRRTQFTQLCYEKLVFDPEWQKVLDEVRRAWLKRSESFPSGSDDNLVCQRWAARLDLANWKEICNEHGQSGWGCTLPDHLQDKKAEQENNEKLTLLTTPFRCRDILNKRHILSDSDLEILWQFLEKLPEPNRVPASESEDEDSTGPEDSICGCIAVLVVLHFDWLKKHPERLRWCEASLEKILSNPPRRTVFSEDDISDDRYDDFAAQILPNLWAEGPDSEGIRAIIARLALSYRYVTAALLNASAATLRERLGKKWDDLQSLLVNWSAARPNLRREEYLPQEKRTFDIAAWEKKWVRPFLKGTIKATPKSWEGLGVPDTFPPRGRRVHDRDVKTRWYDIDVHFLIAIYKWIPSLSEAHSEEERKIWIGTASNFFQAVMRRLPKDLKEDEHIGDVPGEVEHAAFDFSNRILLELKASEGPSNYWKPVLEIGPRGRHWTEAFLSSFLCVGLRPENPSRRFVELWIEMIEFCFESPAWIGGRSHFNRDSWEHLFGWDRVVSNHWIDNRRDIVNRLKDYYWKWLQDVAGDADNLLAFLYFLQQPPARDIVLDACTRLDPLLTNADSYFWRRGHQREAVLSFVSFLWKNHWERLKISPEPLAVFRNLVAQLAAQQEPLALEISVLISNPS